MISLISLNRLTATTSEGEIESIEETFALLLRKINEFECHASSRQSDRRYSSFTFRTQTDRYSTSIIPHIDAQVVHIATPLSGQRCKSTEELIVAETHISGYCDRFIAVDFHTTNPNPRPQAATLQQCRPLANGSIHAHSCLDKRRSPRPGGPTAVAGDSVRSKNSQSHLPVIQVVPHSAPRQAAEIPRARQKA